MDGTVSVFDLLTGLCIDCFQFENAVTSMAFSPNNCFLATTHINTNGIHLWANKNHFENVFTKAIDFEKPILIDSHKYNSNSNYSFDFNSDMKFEQFAMKLNEQWKIESEKQQQMLQELTQKEQPSNQNMGTKQELMDDSSSRFEWIWCFFWRLFCRLKSLLF